MEVYTLMLCEGTHAMVHVWGRCASSQVVWRCVGCMCGGQDNARYQSSPSASHFAVAALGFQMHTTVATSL